MFGPSSRRTALGSRSGLSIACPSCRLPVRRRHEFGTDGVLDGLLENSIDLGHGFSIDPPPENVGDRQKLLGAPGTPQRDVALATIEHPAYGQMDHSSAEAFPRELIEPRNGVK